MRKLIFVILSVCSMGWAQTATITGKVVDPSTSNQTVNTKVEMELIGCNGNQARYNGTALLWPVIKKYDTDSSGNVSGTIYRNDSITCGTSTTSNKWRMAITQNGQSSPPCDVRITSATFDATQPTCLNTSPTVAVVSDLLTYFKVDATNSPVTGRTVFSATLGETQQEPDEGGTLAQYNSLLSVQRITNSTQTPPDNNYAIRGYHEIKSGGADAAGSKTQGGAVEGTVVKRTIGQASGVHSTMGCYAEGDCNGFSTEVTGYAGSNVTGNESLEGYRADVSAGFLQFSATVASIASDNVTYSLGTWGYTLAQSRYIVNTTTGVYSTGTVSSIAGTAPVVTGSGTSWVTQFGAGSHTDLFFQLTACNNASLLYVVPIRSITSNTSLTLDNQALGTDKSWACSTSSGNYKIYKGGTIRTDTFVSSTTGSFSLGTGEGSNFTASDIIKSPIAYNLVIQSVFNGTVDYSLPPIYSGAFAQFEILGSYPLARGLYMAGAGTLTKGIDISPGGGVAGDLIYSSQAVGGGMVMSADTTAASQTFLRALNASAAVRNLVIYDRTGDQLNIAGQSWSVNSGIITAPNFRTTSTNPATNGQIQLAKGDEIDWRNNANGANLALTKNTSDNLVWPNGLSLGGGTALPTTNQSGTGSIAMTTSPTFVTPVLGVAAATSIAIGGGTAIAKYVEGTVVQDVGSISANTCTDTNTITVTGAVDGDTVSVGVLAAVAATAGLQFSAYVSAADTAKVRICNVTTGAIDPASTTYRAGVWVH